jgi:hypothetical protein
MKRLLKKSVIKSYRVLNKTKIVSNNAKEKIIIHKDKSINWIKLNKSILIILIGFSLLFSLIYYFNWWEVIGILFLKFGLGAKVAGAKNFTKAIAKAGGLKIIAMSTATMLTKRHIIDITSKFFIKHSVERYKKNLVHVFKIKWGDFKNSSFMKKVQAAFLFLMSFPLFYFFWTKVLGTAIQKFVYALIIPIFSFIWTFIKGSFNFIGLIFEVIALNVFLNSIAQYEWGQKVLKGIDNIIHFIVSIFSFISNFITYIFDLLGFKFNLKSYLISKSLRFNKWLEKIIDKGLNFINKTQNKRDRYVNGVEKISEKRHIYSQVQKDKKIKFWKTFKRSFKNRFFYNKTWEEKREEIKQKQKIRYDKTFNKKRLDRIEKNKNKRRHVLILPYHNLVRYGEVEYRAR